MAASVEPRRESALLRTGRRGCPVESVDSEKQACEQGQHERDHYSVSDDCMGDLHWISLLVGWARNCRWCSCTNGRSLDPPGGMGSKPQITKISPSHQPRHLEDLTDGLSVSSSAADPARLGALRRAGRQLGDGSTAESEAPPPACEACGDASPVQSSQRSSCSEPRRASASQPSPGRGPSASFRAERPLIHLRCAFPISA